ncbi:MAG: hypothetical protein M1812_001179 [Candelaria pacifica]|nr:MAG: hypothetical protein M1812_001179 [Candelaria pacifica]
MNSQLLNASLDIFDDIVDHCALPDLENLALTCKAMAGHASVKKRMLRKKLERENLPEYLFKVLKQGDPRRARDLRRFRTLHPVFNPSNKLWIQHVAVSQWATMKYFWTIDTKFPNLKSLDLADMMDTYFDEGFSWKEVAETFPNLFNRLECLTVNTSNEGTDDYRAAWEREFEHPCPPPPARGIQKRRSQHGNILQVLLQVCPKLKILRVVGVDRPYKSVLDSLKSSSAIFVSSVARYAPSSLERLDLQYLDIPIKNLSTLLSPLADLTCLKVIGLNIGAWLRAVTTQRDGGLRTVTVSNYRSSDLYLQDCLCSLKAVSDEAQLRIESLDCVNGIVYSSQDLAEVFDLQNHQGFQIMQWFSATYGWRPIIEFDRYFWMVTANRGASFERTKTVFDQLQELNIPVSLHVSFCEASNAKLIALDVVELIAGVVDELVIHMPYSIERRMTNQESSGSRFESDIVSYRQFWQMFPAWFIKVCKVRICVPREIYENWWTGLQPLPLAGPAWHEVVFPDTLRAGAGRSAPSFVKWTFTRWLAQVEDVEMTG